MVTIVTGLEVRNRVHRTQLSAPGNLPIVNLKSLSKSRFIAATCTTPNKVVQISNLYHAQQGGTDQ